MPVVQFGLFEFDAANGTLTREGVQVRLQPQPARVLTVLLDRAGMWAHTYDRPAFTLDVQGEIAESIASQVARCLEEGCTTPLT